MTEDGLPDAQFPNVIMRPVPDPTTLTNELVAKAISALREVLEARISGLSDILNARISSNSEAISVLRSASEQRLQTMELIFEKGVEERNLAIVGAKDLLDEKITALTESIAVFKRSVSERFELGDVQTEKASLAAKEALSAAFAAAKEAVGEQNKSNALSISKSDATTTKQIDQLTENLRLSVKTTDDKIVDLKDRLVAMESRAVGGSQQRQDLNAWVWPLATVLIAAIAIAFSVLERMH